MKLSEATLVFANIRSHHGNAPFDDFEAQNFHSELNPSITFQEAIEAVRRFYSSVSGRWMGAADVNAMVRSMHAERIPSEAEIGRLMDRSGLDLGECGRYLAYRRTLISSIKRGMSVEQAAMLAVEAASTLSIEPAPAKPRKPVVHHFIGRGQTRAGAGSLADVLGREAGQ
ncbi:hypothetical protein CRD60_00995 [Bifidobacterium aemilianum]|uniref:Uncharacterized protein n=1 Tax=Bifidobacterium aemilianum TaxID=2493120 RepID=A0A366KBH8_9BIFI|nr:hypothetical protein [Bifidobacterium aemilianum]RBP98473.1 hypothetical protein CRD60_00995 [Bifidobacterium aemilianum]